MEPNNKSKAYCTEREIDVLIVLSDFELRKEQRALNYPRVIAHELQMSERTVQKVLKTLEAANLVTSKLERAGGRKYRYLTETGREMAGKYREVRLIIDKIPQRKAHDIQCESVKT